MSMSLVGRTAVLTSTRTLEWEQLDDLFGISWYSRYIEWQERSDSFDVGMVSSCLEEGTHEKLIGLVSSGIIDDWYYLVRVQCYPPRGPIITLRGIPEGNSITWTDLHR